MAFVKHVDAKKLLELSKHKNVLVLDVRDYERQEDGYIEGSVHAPSKNFYDLLPKLLDEVKEKDAVICHCAFSQVRGPKCASILSRALSEESHGTSRIPEVYVLERGFNGWASDGYPVVRD